jgi:hypothetical protein
MSSFTGRYRNHSIGDHAGLNPSFDLRGWGIMEAQLMLVQFEVPEEMARQFAAEPGGITRAAAEALAVEGVRSGKLTVY